MASGEDRLLVRFGRVIACCAAMARILVVSYDASLLRTRRMLLESQGYEVVSALDLPGSLDECKRGNFNLLVLGHAIPDEDKPTLIAGFRQHNQAPVIALRLPNQGPLQGADFDVSTEPQDLLNSVAEALAREGRTRANPAEH